MMQLKVGLPQNFIINCSKASQRSLSGHKDLNCWSKDLILRWGKCEATYLDFVHSVVWANCIIVVRAR